MENGLGGGIFDFDGDGELDFGEAIAAAGIFGAFIDEEERASRKAEREASAWDDPDDDGEWFDDVSDGGGWRDALGRDVDLADAFDVMEAVRDPLLDWDGVESLVQDALDAGADFGAGEIEEICRSIYDHDLKDRLRHGD